MRYPAEKTDMLEYAVYSCICRHDGIKAREIEKETGIGKADVNRHLYGSPFMKELCFRDDDWLWHGCIRQARPHTGLEDFCAYYGTVGEFIRLGDDEWFNLLIDGCRRVGRNINDTRGLFNSFRDCRQTMLSLFRDMEGVYSPEWEIAFELKIKLGRFRRIYSDVLVITENRVFSLEFKMKDKIEPEEVIQAAKYCTYLEVLFGPGYDVIPALVLTRARDLYTYTPLGNTDASVPVFSGDMLFNLFDEYLGFLQ